MTIISFLGHKVAEIYAISREGTGVPEAIMIEEACAQKDFCISLFGLNSSVWEGPGI